MSQNSDAQSTNDLLNRAREELKQESHQIQIQGRALSDNEKRRVEKIGRAVDLINQALNELGGDEDTPGW